MVADVDAGADLAAELGEHGGQGVGDRSRAALGDRPSVAVAGGDDGSPDRRGGGPVQRIEGVGGDAAEQGPGLVGPPPPGRDRRRQERAGPEPGQADRVAGHMDDGPHQVVGELVETGRGAGERPPPAGAVGTQTRGRRIDRPPQKAGVAAVERVGAVDLRPPPAQPVAAQIQAGQVGRADAHRVERRAVVMEHARHGELAGPGAAPDGLGGFEHLDIEAVLGQPHRRGQAVRPGANHHRPGHDPTSIDRRGAETSAAAGDELDGRGR